MKASLSSRNDGKTSITLSEHARFVIRVTDPNAMPYQASSNRARAWGVVSLMDGITIEQAHQILELLEPNIQGQVGRPLGWVVDAIDRSLIELHDSESADA
jgi:hypothetical protein